ncbi:YHS domain-containing (seleno)protein [Marimonas sp. MJW-29]|uniref:YHS domain-containing (Seleno)protein n=1 Tax=Sulfitobacter sediminis TaxID=3234186 RepID=A0ABV3RJU8_9RHOB
MHAFSRRSFLLSSGSALIAVAVIPPASAGSSRVSTDAKGRAIRGYDTRAYWREAAAEEGTDAHTVTWNGAIWRFASPAEAELFASDPGAYAPRFGGFCTRAMSLKKVVDSDPTVWRIFDGGLYLFAQPRGGEKFDGNEAEMIARAQAFWDTLD